MKFRQGDVCLMRNAERMAAPRGEGKEERSLKRTSGRRRAGQYFDFDFCIEKTLLMCGGKRRHFFIVAVE